MSKQSFYACVGAIDVSHLLLPGSGFKSSVGLNGDSFCLKLTNDARVISQVDLRSRVQIYTFAPKTESKVMLMYGVVRSGFISDECVTIEGAGMMHVLSETKVGFEFGSKFRPDELLYFTLKSVMPDATSAENISKFDGSGSLADDAYFMRSKPYLFIAPVLWMQGYEESVQIGDALIYNWLRDSIVDDDLIARNSMNKSLEADWAHPVRLRIVVYAQDIVEAFDLGRDAMAVVTDYLVFALNRGVLTTNSGFGWRTYDRMLQDADTRDASWGYVREIGPNIHRYWKRWRAPHLDSSKMGSDVYVAREDVTTMANFVLQKAPGLHSKQERQILKAFKSLRQALECEKPGDSVMHLWRTIEYLASTELMGSVFPQRDESNIRRAVVKAIEGAELSSEEVRSQLLKLLPSQLKRMNEHPLKNKWIHMLERLGVEFTEADAETWQKLRKARNADIHGSDGAVSREEFKQGVALVERVLLRLIEKCDTPNRMWAILKNLDHPC